MYVSKRQNLKSIFVVIVYSVIRATGSVAVRYRRYWLLLHIFSLYFNVQDYQYFVNISYSE